MYEYGGQISAIHKGVHPIHDGDTLRIDLDLGFGVWKLREKFRLIGLQAPELGTPGGREARDWLRDLLPVGTPIIVKTIKDEQEKYGRYLAAIFKGSIDVNDALIDAGHAVPWDGTGPRP